MPGKTQHSNRQHNLSCSQTATVNGNESWVLAFQQRVDAPCFCQGFSPASISEQAWNTQPANLLNFISTLSWRGNSPSDRSSLSKQTPSFQAITSFSTVKSGSSRQNRQIDRPRSRAQSGPSSHSPGTYPCSPLPKAPHTPCSAGYPPPRSTPGADNCKQYVH